MSAAYEAASELIAAAREAHGRALSHAALFGLAEQDVDPFHALTNECLRWRNDGERLIRESELARAVGNRVDLAEQAISALALALQKARDAHRLALASADGLAPGSESEAQAQAQAQADGEAAAAEAEAAASAEAAVAHHAAAQGAA